MNYCPNCGHNLVGYGQNDIPKLPEFKPKPITDYTLQKKAGAGGCLWDGVDPEKPMGMSCSCSQCRGRMMMFKPTT